MQNTTHYGYNVPEFGDAADITKIAKNFIDIDEDIYNASEASKNFDSLASNYGYNLVISKEGSNKIFTKTVKETAPVTAKQVVTIETINGVKTFTTLTTIGENSITLVEKKTSNGWEGSVE